MKSALSLLLCCCGLATYISFAESTTSASRKTLLPGEPTEADLTRARTLLQSWETTAPVKGRRVLRVVYWTPADRDPQPEYRVRLTKVMEHIQGFYRTELASWGFPDRTIQLDTAEDGLLKIAVAKGTLRSADCTEADRSDGQAIRRDALAALKTDGIDGDNETILIFCNLTDWDPEKRTMSHHGPYYASGDSRGGTAWQVDSALLDPRFLAVKDQHLTDGQYGRISLGKYNSIFVGGVCHELGHALGLPHCKESKAAHAARGTALMGSGNRSYGEDLRGESKGSFLSLPHALKLASHPQFSGSIKELSKRAIANFTNVSLQPSADGLRITATCAANLPLSAILAYADPEGNSDYDSEIAAAIPQPDGSFSLLLPTPEKKNCFAMISLIAVAVNGAATAGVFSASGYSLPCRITATSTYDVTPAQEQLALAAYQAGSKSPEELAKFPAKVQDALRRLQRPDNSNGKPKPDSVPAETKSIPLSDTAPDHAHTGWGGVHYDRTTAGKVLTGPNGLLSHGLYAHADSEYTYTLGGKWDTLQGLATILQEGDATVLAEIFADGKSLWKSGKLKSGMEKPFTLPLSGVQVLKLIITAEDKNSAWGAWGNITLQRP